MFYTYILYSESIDRYYVGSCADLATRLQRHNAGWSRSTKHGVPWKLVYHEEYTTKSAAMKRECEIKRKKSRTYFEYLISS
jgi:putative endonuclease